MSNDIACQASSSTSSPTPLKRLRWDRIFTDTGKTLRKVAAINDLRVTAASTEELPSYYHTPPYDGLLPAAVTEAPHDEAPLSSSPLAATTSLPDLGVTSCAAVQHPDVKGCDSCLSGWRLDGRVTACEKCNTHGCICDVTSRASSQKSRSHHSGSLHSSSQSIGGRSAKRQRTADTRPSTPVNKHILSSPSHETWDGSSPVHDSSVQIVYEAFLHHACSHRTTQIHTHGMPHHYIAPLRNKTPSETHSSEKHVSPNLHSASWISSSPVQSELLMEYEEFQLEEVMDEGLLVVSQINDEWDAINYPSS